MKSFAIETNDPVVEQDIIYLGQKIQQYNEGKVDDDQYVAIKKARGIYGQRQAGQSMVRIKVPYGKINSAQLLRLADVTDEFSTGRIHITTRQCVQVHFVSIDRVPEMWNELERDFLTIREGCGNNVRNLTASETAGIDPNEDFDVSPYAQAINDYFLRLPISSDLGRKFKIAFSNNDHDTAQVFMHDIGFIAKQKEVDGKLEQGFKVYFGGGLGTTAIKAKLVKEFITTDQLIPFTESVLRVYERYGFRASKAKARIKFLVEDIGVEKFLQYIEEEKLALPHPVFPIDTEQYSEAVQVSSKEVPTVVIDNKVAFNFWKKTNVFQQKQEGLVAIGVRVFHGDIYSKEVRQLAALIRDFGADELRFTLRQNFLIRNIPEERLEFFYQELKKLGFARPGFQSVADAISCPGTDTCNLGISASTGLAKELETVVENEYPQLQEEKSVSIRISGCTNSCGHHNMAHIGFHGAGIKTPLGLAPAFQVLLGGGSIGGGEAHLSEKVVKIPSKRGPELLRALLDHFLAQRQQRETYIQYYQRFGNPFFKELLEPFTKVDNVTEDYLIDWGREARYEKRKKEGKKVSIDLVTVLFNEGTEKIDFANTAIAEQRWADAIAHAYWVLVNTAKALLVAKGAKTNSRATIIDGFDTAYPNHNELGLTESFANVVLQIRKNKPTESFATAYLKQTTAFLEKANNYHQNTFTS